MEKERMSRKRWRKARRALLNKENVVAVGRGFKKVGGELTSEEAIICSVKKKVVLSQLKAKDRIPSDVEGERTDVVETGVIRALKSRTDKWRPAPGGVSIGHEDVSAGTLGCLVKKNGELFILSNNHVLANSNDASIGSAIIQPGKADGGRWSDRIATLKKFVPIVFENAPPPADEGCKAAKAIVKLLNFSASVARRGSRVQLINTHEVENLVDAALASPDDYDYVKDSILDIGAYNGFAEGVLGAQIQKCGRTTGLTKGLISQVEVAVKVSYGGQKVALFVDQFMAGAMSAGGDSGSAVLNMGENVVGLLFAGSDETTVINPIQYVIDLLGLEV